MTAFKFTQFDKAELGKCGQLLCDLRMRYQAELEARDNRACTQLAGAGRGGS